MQIDRTTHTSTAPGVRRMRRAAGASVFHVAEQEEPEAADQTPATIGLTPAYAIASGQGVGSEDRTAGVSDEAAGQHGHALLAALGNLQAACLAGSDGGQSQALQNLAAMADACPDAATPALHALLRTIVQRAHVEIAKTG